jgi:hypothetical protein
MPAAAAITGASSFSATMPEALETGIKAAFD